LRLELTHCVSLGIEDVRIGSKILTTKLWHNTLIRNGFNGVEIVEGKAQCMAMMVSKAALRANDTPDRANSPLRLVLCPSWTTRPPKFALELSSELNRLGFCLTMECLLTTEFAAEAIFIFLDNGLEPVLTTEDSRVFEHTKSLLLNTTRVLWISCQENPTVNMNPAKGMIAGLARVVRAENESLQLITIDVQDTVAKDFAGLIRIIGKVLEDGISNVLQTPAKELEYVYRNQRLLIPRLISNGRINDCVQQAAGKVMLQAQPFHQPNRPLKLHVSKPGFFDSLLFVDDESLRGQLEASDIEIQVEACGVNFKDILIALGRFNKEMSMTAEFAGKITRVGSIHEGSFQVGDRVCGWGGSSYASTIRLHGHRVAHIPPSMSFELAASIPIAFATAYHGLVEIARLQKDQTVLIHSASGGVGQAALQIAQSIGAEMFVTVGDATKRQLLIKEFGIPEDHIFSSKLRTFRQGILRITNGHGVNVVLNSLSGDGLQESWDCIARFGTFVELGKADALENAGLSMAPFERNVTFASVDLQMIADYQPAKIASLLKKILKRFSNGTYSPISPITTIAIGDIEEAFRLVQTRKHTGKIVLKCGFEALVKAPAMTVDSLSSSFGTCLIAGGLGGLGLEIARFLASHGLKHIALMSRRHLPPSRLTELEEEFQRLGTKIYVLNCDITDISKLIESISPFGLDLPPIKSVIQASTVLQDCAFSQMSLQDFKRATLPKCEGTNNLIEVLKDQSLDFFLMLSSIAGILGMITQGNYAAGNNYMDTLAQNRSDSETGITHLVSLNFGPVDDAGILTNRRYAKERMVRRGFVLLKLKEVLALVKYAISHQARNEGNKQLILGFDYKSIAQSNNTRNLKNPMFSHLIEVQSRENFKDTSPPIQTIQTLIAAIKNADEIELLISEEIARKISDLVAISYEEIDIQHRMAEFGLDSLVTIELKNWITQTFQAKLQASEISDAAHIKALSGIVASRSGLISRDPPDQNYSDDDRRSNPGANGTNFTERRNDEAIILPKQPLPDLDNSLRQFLDSLLPVLTPQEYTKYKGYTNDFCKLNGFGRMLQSRLAQLADNPKVENWLSEFYATGMSLRNRRPLVPWCNFFATHPVAVVPHTAAERAAIISTSAFHFKKKLEAGEIGYEYINEQPTDKDAYHWFFNATRESGTSTDIMKKYPGEDYLVAFRRGHAYKISLGDMDVANSHPALQVVFQNILEAAEKPESWVGILTHDTRDRWAAVCISPVTNSPDLTLTIHRIDWSCKV
jgi:NADPH:quinone reductase-like Zn-dependent oxidoreductase/NADP-dependent 3-hydroxy acid dehydrogenase YdfG